MKTCDLHLHSIASDGTLTPTEVVDLAISKGLSAIVLTDHNNIHGLKEFSNAAEGRIEYLGGCEFSTERDGKELHLIAMGIKEEYYDEIEKFMAKQLKIKEESNRKIFENLKKDGYKVDYDEMVEMFGGTSVINRGNISNYLAAKKIVDNPQYAFSVLLNNNGKYYVPWKRVDFQECIDFIHSIGAVAVWAHPLFHVDMPKCEEILKTTKGLDGIEVYYTTYSDEQQKFANKMARKYHLLKSGGSDFHGDTKPDTQIGIGYGNLVIPYSCYKKIAAKLKK